MIEIHAVESTIFAGFKQGLLNGLLCEIYENVCFFSSKLWGLLCTIKPVNKGHPTERQTIVIIDKWSLFGGCFVLFLSWKSY